MQRLGVDSSQINVNHSSSWESCRRSIEADPLSNFPTTALMVFPATKHRLTRSVSEWDFRLAYLLLAFCNPRQADKGQKVLLKLSLDQIT
jgi:hypothetical protein